MAMLATSQGIAGIPAFKIKPPFIGVKRYFFFHPAPPSSPRRAVSAHVYPQWRPSARVACMLLSVQTYSLS